ncbi:MAG: hypothetical protein WBS54_04435 [Acidobacteriota bacterium]
MSDREDSIALGFLAGCLLFLAMACSAVTSKGASDRAQVNEALKRYSELQLHQDSAGIAALFTPNRMLKKPLSP